MGNREEVYETVREVFLDRAAVTTELVTGPEHVFMITVMPRNDCAAPMVISVRREDAVFDARIGAGAEFSAWPLHALRDLCVAVRAGRVEEEVVMWGRRVARDRAVVDVDGKKFTSSYDTPLLRLLLWMTGRHRVQKRSYCGY